MPPDPDKITITHCIFDMDGLLLDTETLYTIAQQQILDRFGKVFTWELKVKMMGAKAIEAASVLIAELGLTDEITPEEFVKEREDILNQKFPDSALMPGADKLLRHLSACNVPIALATSSHFTQFQLKTMNHRNLFSMFNVIVTGDQVANGKPHPDIFVKAAATFDPPAVAKACLVFEDAPNGAEAAVAAGMSVVMVPDTNVDRAKCQQGSQVLNSLEEFCPEEWGLPPYAA